MVKDMKAETKFLLLGLKATILKTKFSVDLNALEQIERDPSLAEEVGLLSLSLTEKERLESLHDSFYRHTMCPVIYGLWRDRGWCEQLAVKTGYAPATAERLSMLNASRRSLGHSAQ